ncbi:hypothetical protein [Massilia timonae]|uniref:hypothetical protein n=1 Tax=Massilia timonae TaxID=47229 RepID=UPI002353B670|nr:hypothetical protein [Massilia timonae]
MSDPSLYCFPRTLDCRLMAEWGVFWQALSTICAVIVGAVGLYKIYRELERLYEQRQKDIDDKNAAGRLKRTEFFLNQHRRLFDNTELFSVLCLIDGDELALATGVGMPDKKRKFLTFLEEIALLVKSGQIDAHVAYYMFGYYANCALTGKNFASGIDTSKKYWGLLYQFAAASRDYLDQHPDGPPHDLSL